MEQLERMTEQQRPPESDGNPRIIPGETVTAGEATTHEQGQPSSHNLMKSRALRWTGGILLVAAAGVYAYAAIPENASDDPSCNTASRESVAVGYSHGLQDKLRSFMPFLGDNPRTWAEVASELSEHHGYDISGARVMQSNASLVTDTKATAQSDIGLRTVVCFDVPAAIPSGLTELPAGTTLKEFAQKNEADLPELRGMNPDIQANKVLPPGTLINIDSVIDPANILQDANGMSIREIAHGNSAKADQLFEANRFVLGSIHFNGQDVLDSTSLYYPPHQTEWMKDHSVSAHDVTQLVKDTFLSEKPETPTQTK